MLRRNWLHVLIALAERDLHGAAIADDVLQRTHGALRLWPGHTLPGARRALVEAGLVTELDGEDRPDGESRRKRYYRVTADGRAALAEEARRLEGLAHEAWARLGHRA